MDVSIEQLMVDDRKMKRYIYSRIPPDGTRIYLTDSGEGGPAIYADIIPILDEHERLVELEIETNEPEWTTLIEVYRHFRFKDMTTDEWQQWWHYQKRNSHSQTHTHTERAQYHATVESLSTTERELFEAASEMSPIRGEALVAKAGLDYCGHTKGCLANLVKLGLLTKRKGYVRVPMPQ